MNRNDAVIRELLTTNYAYFYRIAYSYVRNEADAQDIVQESAYKAIYHSGRLKKTEYAQTWVCRIVINEALSFLRKHKKEVLPEGPELELVATKEGITKEETVDLKDAIGKLLPEEQTVITLRFFEDMKLDQIAEVLGESLSTIKSRLYRTLKKLRLDLEITEE